ncbi:MAG: VOC family protein [Caldilineaceae bacterium]|nr:VOC family protein [Caldilineaceae bacterium]MCB9139483.1 VOC family protein [Caldilineaceae bacterium]
MSRPPIEQQVTFFYTPDLAAAAHFYETVLELPLVLDQGSCRIYRVSGDAFLGFCERTDAGKPEGVIFTLVTHEVDAWYEHLLGHGVRVEKPPAYNPAYNIYQFFARDPSGYLLEIQTFLDPAWPQAN